MRQATTGGNNHFPQSKKDAVIQNSVLFCGHFRKFLYRKQNLSENEDHPSTKRQAFIAATAPSPAAVTT
jgi:hypothetical protein